MGAKQSKAKSTNGSAANEWKRTAPLRSAGFRNNEATDENPPPPPTSCGARVDRSVSQHSRPAGRSVDANNANSANTERLND